MRKATLWRTSALLGTMAFCLATSQGRADSLYYIETAGFEEPGPARILRRMDTESGLSDMVSGSRAPFLPALLGGGGGIHVWRGASEPFRFVEKGSVYTAVSDSPVSLQFNYDSSIVEESSSACLVTPTLLLFRSGDMIDLDTGETSTIPGLHEVRPNSADLRRGKLVFYTPGSVVEWDFETATPTALATFDQEILLETTATNWRSINLGSERILLQEGDKTPMWLVDYGSIPVTAMEFTTSPFPQFADDNTIYQEAIGSEPQSVDIVGRDFDTSILVKRITWLRPWYYSTVMPDRFAMYQKGVPGIDSATGGLEVTMVVQYLELFSGRELSDTMEIPFPGALEQYQRGEGPAIPRDITQILTSTDGVDVYIIGDGLLKVDVASGDRVLVTDFPFPGNVGVGPTITLTDEQRPPSVLEYVGHLTGMSEFGPDAIEPDRNADERLDSGDLERRQIEKAVLP